MRQITTLFTALLLTSITNSYAAPPEKRGPIIPGPQKYQESTVLFQVDPDASPSALKRFNALINPSTLLDLKNIDNVVTVAKVKNIKGFEKSFAKQLAETGAVKFAEPDAEISHALEPNDGSWYTQQWHHQTINSPSAWDKITSVDPAQVTVCVLDTGADTDHVDLVDNLILPGYNARLEVAGNVEDAHGHGTGTAGVIGAVGNNGLGVAGMAWDVGIIPVQINISDGNSSAYISDMATGITWCADQGVKVVNLSYGGASSQTINNAATYLRNAGGLLFMSAGNDGNYYDTNSFPDYDSFVIVGATDDNDAKAGFSQYGPYVDITAPGVSILTTYPDNQLIFYSGTSFSSPMTAGLAALIYGVNPALTPAEVENYIFNTAFDIGDPGDDAIFGHGRIDAGAAVSLAYDDVNSQAPNMPPVALATSDVNSGFSPLTVIFDASDSYDPDPDGSVENYMWDFGDGNSASGEIVSHTYNNPGSFEASVTVTDNRFAEAQSTPISIQVDQDPNVVNAPSNLVASVEGNNVQLSWSHDNPAYADFEIERGTKFRGKIQFNKIGTVSAQLNYLDENVEAGKYSYRVRAKSSTNELTDYTNEIQVTVEASTSTGPEPTPTVSAPTLTSDVSGDSITLSWSDTCSETSEACGYLIEHGTTKQKGTISDFSKLAVCESECGNSFPTTGTKGTNYYRVYAIEPVANGETYNTLSESSNIESIRIR